MFNTIRSGFVAGFVAYLSVSANAQYLRSYTSALGVYVGTTVDPSTSGWLENSNEPNYTAIVGNEFSSVTTGNTLKWDWVESTRGTYNWAAGDQIVAFAQNHSQNIRGHTLVWYNQLPSWLSSWSGNASELESVLKKHITDEVGRYKGVIKEWDVANEILNDDGTWRSDSLWYKYFNTTYLAKAFKWANEADPSARLYLNDYNIEGTGSKSDAYYTIVKDLLSQGVPIHGVGFQAHFIVGQFPSSMTSNMQRFADLGLDVEITELDVRMALPATNDSLTQQAADYKSAFKACLDVSRCRGVTVWGFTDKNSWVPGVFSGYGAACLWDEYYQYKSAYWSVHDLLASYASTKTTTTTTTTKASTSTTTSAKSTTTTTSSKTTTTTSKTTTSTKSSTTSSSATATASCAALWGQCGGYPGQYTGPTCCQSGSKCVYNNDWYSQCLSQ